MHRRDLLKAGLAANLFGATTSTLSQTHAAETQQATDTLAPARPSAPPIMISYAAADHRRRLLNIARCEKGIRTCLRRHTITDYIPGHCVYNLGEYPSRRPYEPDETDARILDQLAAHGIGLIHIHEEWNDSQRLFGADKFTASNPAGLRRFVRMVHDRGMKIILYISSSFFETRDPDFRPEWAGGRELVELHYHYARCSPASPGWRAYLLPRIHRMLEDYEIDGLYNDMASSPQPLKAPPPQSDQVLAFEDTPTHDGALTDLLGLIYAEVKRRGGIVKVHQGGNTAPRTSGRVYDYLWVGEGVKQGVDNFSRAVKDFTPYVTPCLDMSRVRIPREDDQYLAAIPYMQFPVLLGGRPFTGERGVIPGIDYPPEEKCFWTRHCRAIWKQYQQHPEGPHTYGWWDSVPGRPEAIPTHRKWLTRYMPLAEEGTRAYIEIADSDFFATPLPASVVATAFANRDLHLVLANFNAQPVEVATSETWKDTALPGAEGRKHWSLPPNTLMILRNDT